jgi:hypothetical protein
MRSLLRRLAALAALLLVLAGPARAAEWASAPELPEEPTALPSIPPTWVTEHGPLLEVHGPEGTEPLLLDIARTGSDQLAGLARTLDLPLGGTVHVYVTDSTERFRDLQPGHPPAWADATAYPQLGAIFLRSPRVRGLDQFTQVLKHELVHILLGRAFAPTAPPSWLQEGVAQAMAGEFGPDAARALGQGAVTNSLLSLQALDGGFPHDPHQARLAYAQSADFILWLQGTYGEQALRDLIHDYARTGDLTHASRAATGEYIEDLDRKWRAHLGFGSAAWFTGLTTEDLLWATLAAIAGVSLIFARRRIRRRMAEMAERERAEEAFFAAMAARRVAGPARLASGWTDLVH